MADSHSAQVITAPRAITMQNRPGQIRAAVSKLLPSLLIAVLNNLWTYRPPASPLISELVKPLNGRLDKNLEIPVADRDTNYGSGSLN